MVKKCSGKFDISEPYEALQINKLLMEKQLSEWKIFYSIAYQLLLPKYAFRLIHFLPFSPSGDTFNG